MRLIDAEHLKRWIMLRWESGISVGYDDVKTNEILEQIDRELTINLEPRKKGRWIEHHEPYSWMGYAYWSCSKCNFGEKEENKERSNFCPNCGADMREGEEE